MVVVAPSTRRRAIVALLASGSLAALASCGLPPLPLVALAGVLLLLSAHAFAEAASGGTITLVRDAPWRLEGFGRADFEGVPASGGYRGRAALVLVLGTGGADRSGGTDRLASRLAATLRDRRSRRRLVVHADSVSASDFSLLHLHLALPAGHRT